jgi:hypothetical protein
LRGFGVVNTIEGASPGGPLTLGNKPEGYIWAQMGIDYSRDEFLDFLNQSTDPRLQMLYEIDRLNRISFAQEFQRRWEDLKALAKERDTKTYQYMLNVEAQARTTEQRKGEERFQELLRQEQKHNQKILDMMNSWRPQSPQYQSTRPATTWQPPPLPTPTATVLPPPPPPQPPVWKPLPYEHPSGGGDGCDDGCGDPGGQPDISVGAKG